MLVRHRSTGWACLGRPAGNLNKRLRAREDGENPSPPRDCKAEKFVARVTVGRFRLALQAFARTTRRWEGRAHSFTAKPGDRRSLNPGSHARSMSALRVRTTFYSRARGRKGHHETPERHSCIFGFSLCADVAASPLDSRTTIRNDHRRRDGHVGRRRSKRDDHGKSRRKCVCTADLCEIA